MRDKRVKQNFDADDRENHQQVHHLPTSMSHGMTGYTLVLDTGSKLHEEVLSTTG